MPELPEVETVARQLDKSLSGQRISDLIVLDSKLDHLPGQRSLLCGSRLDTVFRTGKQVALTLNHGTRDPTWLLVHLRMTGRLFHHQSLPEDNKHVRVRLLLEKGCLDFVDTRRFGTVVVCRSRGDLIPPGIEPFSGAFTAKRLLELAARSTGPIKAFLLRQDRITGLGNIYVCEILHACGVSPHRAANSLSPADWSCVVTQTLRILTLAIELCGTTFRDFQDSRGTEGGFAAMLAVYARAGQPCPRCGGSVIREAISQRGSFWCPGCQG